MKLNLECMKAELTVGIVYPGIFSIDFLLLYCFQLLSLLLSTLLLSCAWCCGSRIFLLGSIKFYVIVFYHIELVWIPHQIMFCQGDFFLPRKIQVHVCFHSVLVSSILVRRNVFLSFLFLRLKMNQYLMKHSLPADEWLPLVKTQ